MSMNGRFLIVPTEKRSHFAQSDDRIDDLDYVSVQWVEQAWHILAALTDQYDHVEGELPHDSSCTGSLLILNFETYGEALRQLSKEDILQRLRSLQPDELEDIYWGRMMQQQCEDLVLDSFESIRNLLIDLKTKGAKYDLYLSVV